MEGGTCRSPGLDERRVAELKRVLMCEFAESCRLRYSRSTTPASATAKRSASSCFRTASSGVGVVASLTFDDGWADNVRAASLLADHGMRGTFYVNTNTVGTRDRLSWPQLGAMAAAGHDIGGHTLDHVDLTTVTGPEARRQVADDRRNLLARGFAALSFAYPFGEFNEAAQRIVRECGYTSARAASGLRNLTARHDPRSRVLPIPPPNPFAILTPCCIRADTPLFVLQLYIGKAERRGRGWIPLTLHRISDDGGGDGPAPSMSAATFEGLLAWLERRASRGTVVRTVADVVGVAAAWR